MATTSETSYWINFFTSGGIPAGDATHYAIIFCDNRITRDMLLDLTKEYLTDMGISRLGDVIAILKHAKQVFNQEARDKVMKSNSLSSESFLQSSSFSSSPRRSTAASRMVNHFTSKHPEAAPMSQSPIPKPPPSEGHPGIKIGGSNINNLRYADDTVLIAENEKDLQQLLDIVKEESEKKGLELNRKKTEVMVVSRKQELPIINIYIKGTRLKQKDQFKYLGSLISSDGRNNSEVASRIAQAKTNFQKMKTVLTNKNISIRTRRRALECYIEPILMYGCEAWTISKQTQKKLEATEMWFLRRMLRISWTAKKTNDTVLEEAHTTRLLISKIRKRQATFFSHVMRREKLENLVTTGMLEGKRSRGKQREKLIESLADWLKAGKSLEAIEATKDRKKWRTMIANAVKQGT
ncbi:endonuclease-reverse transcriptase [Plakobranchus ocellatus]|uniref:Endonuclease-reverse transcriptase n=1 Tax=Plakobranchus ocellatus TaxID=259542 RepID=A0AAV4CTF8_9GAST|nr:endonuclease-reverse transcriptase [Plakobranchus ocellatus]